MVQPVINSVSRHARHKYTPLQQYQRIHLACMHLSESMIIKMVEKGTMTDMPKAIIPTMRRTACTCYICLKTKSTKLPRGQLVDKTNIPPFLILHLDFHFFNVKSIRGFESALAVSCGSTSYAFNFPTRSRAPPIHILSYLVNVLRTLNYKVLYLKVDEDGSLARSSEFCSKVEELNCVLQTTGGYNSTSNGQVERSNRFDANVVRPSLSTMNLLMGDKLAKLPKPININKFWCCALNNGTIVHRMVYNRMRKDSPYYLVHKTRPSVKQLVPLGSFITIIEDNHQPKVKKLNDRGKLAHFCGYGSNFRYILYWE